MNEPLAYLLTWTCYGTWLHGDRRGSIDSKHNAFGTPFVRGSQRRAETALKSLQSLPVELADTAREIVRDTIVEHCRLRKWTMHAVNVRSNHVHVVVSAMATAPERVMSQLKAWSTRRLREGGQFAPEQPVWTRHGSTRYLWHESSVAGAIRYVNEMQGKPLT
jgi:REP element-mobilizing transposase RayT